MNSNDSTPRDRGLAGWLDEPIIEPGARIITQMKAQRKDPNRVSVFLDGEFAFGLPHYVVAKHLLRKGMHISPALEAELLREDQLARAKSRALDYLSYCARTEHEVAKKLREKAFDEEIIAEVIVRFKELNYLDDAQYARLYARSRLQSKGRGPRRIKMELKKRGVMSDHVEAALTHLRETEDFIEALRPKAEKRWNKLSKERDPRKRRQKFCDFLLRQGFNFPIAQQLYTELKQQDEEAAANAEHDPYEDTVGWHPIADEEPTSPDDAVEHEEERDELEEIRPIAEKRWSRLASETSPYRKRQKLSEFLRRRGFSFDLIKAITEELEAQDAEEAEAAAAEAPEFEPEPEEIEEPVDPLEVIRPLAEKRWRRLCKGESNVRKRRQKLTDYLRRQGFSFSEIKPIFDELEGA